MTSSDYYFGIADLKGKDRLCKKIAYVDHCLMGVVDSRNAQSAIKLVPVLFFDANGKGLRINPEMSDVIASGYGADTAGWIGKNITLVADAINPQKPVIRVELPESGRCIDA